MIVTLLLPFLLGAGCAPISDVIVSTDVEETSDVNLNQWIKVNPEMDRMEYAYGEDEDQRMILYRFAKETYTLRFAVDEEAPKRVAEWRTTYPDAAVVTNGVYFHEDYSPSGFLVTDGTRYGFRSFDLDRSALVTFAPVFEIIDTALTPMPDNLTEAAQTYPFLIKNGAAAVQEDSGLTARRTFIGEDASWRGYLGIIPFDEISLYDLSRVLDEMDINWEDVVNLDGGPSSGFSATTEGVMETYDSFTPVPSAVVMELR